MARSQRRAAITLGLIVVVATGLRLWRLDVPPTWLDESVTALIAAGRGPAAFPMARIVPLAQVVDTFNPRVSATTREVLAVFRDPLVQDLHPPTFHLLSNLALRSGLMTHVSLVAGVRALAVLFGVGAVIAMYFAARQVFDPRTALVAAAMVAVSPYGVMLSREARNYSFAMLLVTISTGAMLAVARKIDDEGRADVRGWSLWVASAAAGLYVHYFALFACVAQAGVLAVVCWRRRWGGAFRPLAVASVAIAGAFLPWLPVLVYHQASPEQTWLRFDVLATTPLEVPYQIVSAWQTMLLGKAWDLGEPIYTISKVGALVVYLGVLAAVVWGVARGAVSVREQRPVRLLLMLVGTVLALYVAAMVLQRKDFVSEPRYHVVYYPPLVLIVAWVFTRRLHGAAIAVLLAAGALNSVMVDLGVETWKGTDPPPVMARFRSAPPPSLIVAGVGNFNETVVQGSLMFEFSRGAAMDGRSVAFIGRTESPAYGAFNRHVDPSIFWERLLRLRPNVAFDSVLVHSGGMLPEEYRPSFVLTSETGQLMSCTGMTLHDEANRTDNLLMHPAFRRYACRTAPAPAAP